MLLKSSLIFCLAHAIRTLSATYFECMHHLLVFLQLAELRLRLGCCFSGAIVWRHGARAGWPSARIWECSGRGASTR